MIVPLSPGPAVPPLASTCRPRARHRAPTASSGRAAAARRCHRPRPGTALLDPGEDGIGRGLGLREQLQAAVKPRRFRNWRRRSFAGWRPSASPRPWALSSCGSFATACSASSGVSRSPGPGRGGGGLPGGLDDSMSASAPARVHGGPLSSMSPSRRRRSRRTVQWAARSCSPARGSATGAARAGRLFSNAPQRPGSAGGGRRPAPMNQLRRGRPR